MTNIFRIYTYFTSMISKFLSFLLILVFSSSAQCFEKTIPFPEFEDLQIKVNTVKFNNFFAKIDGSFLSTKQNLIVELSATNRGEAENISISIVGLKENKQPIWSVDASPSMWTLIEGSSTLKGEVYATGDELVKTKFVWIKVLGLD